MADDILIDHQLSKAEKYEQLLPQIKTLIEAEENKVANLANVAAILKYNLNFFWVGFYELNQGELVLGPFQGPLACTRIAIGKGVCGTAFERKESIIVPDVDLFEGHIACSSETKSEIVIPILSGNQAVAVLDVDSKQLDFFDETDQQYLEKLAQILSNQWAN